MDSKASIIWDLAEAIAADLELEVLEVEVSGGSPKRVLRVYLDTATGDGSVTVADCEAVSRQLGDALDAREEVRGHYMLEVSSPGLNRPLRRVEHFRRVLGNRVRLRLAHAIHGRRDFVGRLEAVEDEAVAVVSDSDERFCFELADIERANLEYEFEENGQRRRKR